MKSFSGNRVVIQVSPEKPQWFLIFQEETLCWPVPPRLPAHGTPRPLLLWTHSSLLQISLLNILGVSSQPSPHQLGGLAPLALPARPCDQHLGLGEQPEVLGGAGYVCFGEKAT